MDNQLSEFFNTWLDTVQQVFGEVLKEWDENGYIQPIIEAKTEFKCNDCGKCCNFKGHDVWVYPYDMIKWIQEFEEEKYIPLFMSALIPVQDVDDVIGVGLPSQKQIHNIYHKIIQEKKGKENIIIRRTLTTILHLLKIINPVIDEKSDNCIYYDPNPSKGSGHCKIYSHRPIQCRAYPYDFPSFTEISIPHLEESDDKSSLPMCPTITYTHGDPKMGIKTTEEERNWVLLEKANYRTSTVIKQWAEEADDWREWAEESADLTDLLLELFQDDIFFLTRKQKQVTQSNQTDKRKNLQKSAHFKGKRKDSIRTKKYVAGRRPQRK